MRRFIWWKIQVSREQMSADFLEMAKKRKTTYEFDLSKNVPASKVNKILEAGRWSPSCLNIQPWHFVVVKDRSKIRRLMDVCPYGAFHTDPPLMIAVVMRPTCEGNHRICSHGQMADLNEAYMCSAMAALNMAYEAMSNGLSSCFLSPMSRKANEILRVPKDHRTILLVCIGKERRNGFSLKRTRAPLEEMTSNERFGGG